MRIFSGRAALFACATSAAALLSGETAFAQGGSAPAAAALDEIVVTARRREERLQDVPVVVTAMTAEKLQEAQVTTARQLVSMVPSLNIATGNQRDYQRYTIRGQSETVGAAEGVAVYFAEAPISRFIAGGPGLYSDLENLQVLNGPQGTLFGRNTTGGAVLFAPAKPTDRNEGYVQAGYGNYNNRELGLVANFAPLPDVLKFRVSYDYRKRDGFTTSLADFRDLDDINYYTVRAGMLFTPSDRFENYLVAQYTRSATGGTGIILTDVNPTGTAQRVFGATTNFAALLARQQELGTRYTQGGADHWWYTKTFLAVNTTTFKLTDNLTLKNIASFQRARVSGGFDNDGTPLPLVEWTRSDYSSNASGNAEGRNEYLTEELQLNGTGLDGKLNWVLGGYYANSYPYGFQETLLLSFGTPTPNNAGLKSSTKAVFGQASLDFGAFSTALDKLKLTVGYRYTWDRSKLNAGSWRVLSPTNRPCNSVAGAQFPNCIISLKGSWESPTWNVGLDYKLTDDILVYAAVRRGYKTGGFNPNANVQIPATFGPEEVTDYEVGVKADFRLGGMPVRTNVAAFYDDYTDIQRSVFRDNPLQPGAILTFISNASSATIKGVETQVSFKPTENLELDLNYSYLDATYDEYLFLDASVNRIVDFAGHPLPFSPKHKIGGNIRYHVPVGEEWGDLSVYVGANYQGHYKTTDQPQPGWTLGDYTLVNLGATWKNIGQSPVDADLFMTNVLNEKAVAGAQIFYYAIGITARSYIEPRMFGVRLRYKFGG